MNNDLLFKQFLEDATAQKELPLALAKDNEEFVHFHDLMTEQGFVGSDKIFDVIKQLESKKKIYFVINQHNIKIAYDFILQYPTGQVNLLNKEDMSNISYSPKYNSHSLVLLTTDEFISHLQKNSLNFLENIGMVYRSKG